MSKRKVTAKEREERQKQRDDVIKLLHQEVKDLHEGKSVTLEKVENEYKRVEITMHPFEEQKVSYVIENKDTKVTKEMEFSIDEFAEFSFAIRNADAHFNNIGYLVGLMVKSGNPEAVGEQPTEEVVENEVEKTEG